MCSYRTVSQILPFMLMVLLPQEVQSRVPDQGHGTVGMQGSIINTPCAIAVNDIDQAVEMGVSTTGELIHDGLGPAKVFRIHLMGCTLKPQQPLGPDWTWFQVTFDGIPDGELFSIRGADGIGLRITDLAGNVARPGIPLPSAMLKPEAQVLEYSLRVVGAPHRLVAGDYRATVRFKVDYF
ncbi:fimbrial protein [Enterobacter cloacae complex sp. I2]|uniref:fimbrial protein n=1 Tax=Enterobacter cloacae complex sp. I2 TaxID=2779603 RepID=UPI001D02BBB9|nr:fimbrial protein [Enterobacter cloacae complex sp. I2]